MPPWLVELFAKLSPEGTATSFLGSLATLIALVIVRVMQERKKLDKAMASIPPTVRAVTEPSLAAELEQTRAALQRANWRIQELQGQLREVGEDHGRTAAALTRERAESERLGRYVEVLEHRLSTYEPHGHDRPAPRTAGSSPALLPIDIEVVEVDDRPTPREGTAPRKAK